MSLGCAYPPNCNFPKTEVEIQCKGTNLEGCQGLVLTPSKNTSWVPESFSLTSDFYVKKDENNNILEEWGPNGCTNYSYDKAGNLQRQTDENGNVLWARRIYTVEEAAKATNGKNTFSIRYR